MTLSKWATTVTPLSKTLALIIFITFPIIAFILGMRYQQIISSQNLSNYKTITPQTTNTNRLKPTVIPSRTQILTNIETSSLTNIPSLLTNLNWQVVASPSSYYLTSQTSDVLIKLNKGQEWITNKVSSTPQERSDFAYGGHLTYPPGDNGILMGYPAPEDSQHLVALPPHLQSLQVVA